MPVCPPVSPCRGASIGNGCASCVMHKHFNAWKRRFCGCGCVFCRWKRILYGWGMCPLRMEMPLRGRSGGHTGTAPTISHVAPCPKVASEQFADGLNRKRLLANSSPTDKTRNDCRRTVRRWTKSKKVAGEQFADGLNRKKVAGE